MVKYFYHDGSFFIVPQYTTPKGMQDMFRTASEVARDEMKKSNASHAIYGVKSYDEKTGSLKEFDVYMPPVVLNEEEFEERTKNQYDKDPHSMILAVHAMA